VEEEMDSQVVIVVIAIVIVFVLAFTIWRRPR
jgi:hypothetical protein